MKDRIARTNVKKSSHRLKRSMFAISFVTAICTVFFTIFLINVTTENKVLTKQIENYTVQIDRLEHSDDTTLLKNNVSNNP